MLKLTYTRVDANTVEVLWPMTREDAEVLRVLFRQIPTQMKPAGSSMKRFLCSVADTVLEMTSPAEPDVPETPTLADLERERDARIAALDRHDRIRKQADRTCAMASKAHDGYSAAKAIRDKTQAMCESSEKDFIAIHRPGCVIDADIEAARKLSE